MFYILLDLKEALSEIHMFREAFKSAPELKYFVETKEATTYVILNKNNVAFSVSIQVGDFDKY